MVAVADVCFVRLPQGAITNTQRIDAALPTINYALANGAKVRRVAPWELFVPLQCPVCA